MVKKTDKNLIVGLDIGTSKVVAIVGELSADGEIEIISIKSGKNIVRGNTFVNNEGLVTLRHGTQSIIENNIFLLEGKKNGGGVRVYDKGHTIRNNYFSGIRSSSSSNNLNFRAIALLSSSSSCSCTRALST